jgi:lipopolysaccharide export LptBFGC system permease protein LptF
VQEAEPRLSAAAAPAAGSRSPQRHRLGRTIRRYTVRHLAQAFALLVAIFAFAVLAAELVDYSDLIINRGFGAAEVGTIAFHRMVPVLAQTLPFALLVAALTAIGRMGSDRALLALEASGVSALRLTRPILAFSLGVALVTLAISW